MEDRSDLSHDLGENTTRLSVQFLIAVQDLSRQINRKNKARMQAAVSHLAVTDQNAHWLVEGTEPQTEVVGFGLCAFD